MTLVKLCSAYLRLRFGTAVLNVTLVALGVLIVAVVLLVGSQLRERIERQIRGIDLVVGAKGSPLQLILSVVFQIDVPSGNVNVDDVAFLRTHPLVASAVPVALGDSAFGFRLLGSEPSFLNERGISIGEGRVWEEPMEAVLGAEVARTMGLRVGSQFLGSHGLTGGIAHGDHPYTVVGIARPTGTVVDRLILTSLESVWRVHTPRGSLATPPEGDGRSREITALLVRYRTPLAAIQLPRLVNAKPMLIGAAPAFEAARLLSLVGFGLDALRVFGWVLLVTAAGSVLVALTNALSDRRADLALMRVLGATRGLLIRLLLLEAVVLAGAGSIVGLSLAHLSLELFGRFVPEAQAAGLSGLALAQGELWLVPGTLLLAVFAAATPAVRAYRADLVGTLVRG
jgi:putative ABC transport system permease protein